MTDIYCNEFDPKAAAWLRELPVVSGGIVDERSINEVIAADLLGRILDALKIKIENE